MSTAPKMTSREEEGIHTRIDEFVSVWNTHNPTALSIIFAEDADLVSPFGRVVKSRSEIERLFKDEHDGPLKDSRMSLKSESVRLLTSDVAITDHWFDIAGVRDKEGKDVPTLRGHLTGVLQKHGEMWLVVASRPMVPLYAPGGR